MLLSTKHNTKAGQKQGIQNPGTRTAMRDEGRPETPGRTAELHRENEKKETKPKADKRLTNRKQLNLGKEMQI